MSKIYDLDVYRMTAIGSDTEADIVMQDLEQEIEERDRLISIVRNEIALLQDKITGITLQYENKLQHHNSLIYGYLLNAKMKETKTQFTYKLPAAKLTVHKQREDTAVIDDEALFAQLDKTEGLKHCIKTVRKVDWKETKTNVVTADGKAFFVDQETGEMVPAEGIEVVTKDNGRITIGFDGGIKYEFTATDNDGDTDAPCGQGESEIK